MKILIVEDDCLVMQALQILLSGCGYASDAASDAESAIEMASAFTYDLLILDVALPKMDGITLCQQLRSYGLQAPILLLTGQGETRQKAIALNAGADDYVVKPFDPDELVARVQALLRRGDLVSQPMLQWGELAVDPSTRQVTYGTRLLSVTPKEYAILELFLRNPQKAWSASAILNHVWNSLESPGEEAVRVHIKELRQKFAAAGAPSDFIRTVYRVGYRLNPMYSAHLSEQSADQLKPTQVAELRAVNEELRTALETLRQTQEELRQRNLDLEHAYETIEQERQLLQAARDSLELRVAERTLELTTMLQALQQQHQQWQTLFNHVPDAILIVDDGAQVVEANPAASAFFGLDRAGLVGKTLGRLTAPGLDVASFWDALLQQGYWVGRGPWYGADRAPQDTTFAAIAHFSPNRHLIFLREVQPSTPPFFSLLQMLDFA